MTDESHVLKHESDRSAEFQPNPRLVELIGELRSMLEPVQAEQSARFTAPRRPVAVIVGCPRSGTTVLSQILAATGDFAYPSNFLSRFAYAPRIGAMIQKMLFDPDFDHRGELADIQSSSNFSSQIGKTDGALGISEFFHFWRKFFPNHDPGHLTEEQLDRVDTDRMRRELASIEAVFDKPFASKGMMMQYNLGFFAERVPELFFIHIRRRPRFLMQSVLVSRKKYYTSPRIWWSVKPKEYPWLADMDLIHQVAGQVLFTERAIDAGLAKVEDGRRLVCDYQTLCADPSGFYSQLRAKFDRLGCPLDPYRLEQTFPCGDRDRLPAEEIEALQDAYTRMAES